MSNRINTNVISVGRGDATSALQTSAVHLSSISADLVNGASGLKVSAAGFGKLQACVAPSEKLTVTATSSGFSNWPTSGLITTIFTVETNDVCYQPSGTATSASSRILRVGTTQVLDAVDPTLLVPKFIRYGVTNGEVRADFYIRVVN